MISNPLIYDVLLFDNVKAAGTVIPGSLELSPSFEFDTPTAAGVDGAYVIFKGYKPATWSVSMQCFTKAHMQEYLETVAKIGPKPGKKNRPKVLRVKNGWFAQRDIPQVYVTEISTLKKEGSGAFTYVIKGVEYRTVKKNPVVAMKGPTGNELRDRTQGTGYFGLAKSLARKPK